MRTNLTSLFTDIADAIRAKKGTSAQISPQDFASEIQGITSGGGSGNNGDDIDETQFHKITAIYVTDEMNYDEYDEKYIIQVIGSYATVERMFVNGVEVEEPESYYYAKEYGTYIFELWIPTENWQTEISSLFTNADPTIIILPNSINEIPGGTFAEMPYLETVIIPNSVTSIGDGAFNGCNKLVNINIPDGVTSIGNSTFYFCNKLVNINIPDSVTSIGNNAFSFCSLAEISVNIPDGVTSIESYLFCENRSIQEVSIPAGVTSIGDSAFKGCSRLENVYCKAITPPTSGTRIFDNNASNRKIYVPTGSVDAYKAANGWSNYADAIEGYNFN